MEENQQPCDILRQMPTLSHMELCPTASRLLKVAQALQFLENEVEAASVLPYADDLKERELAETKQAFRKEWAPFFWPLRDKLIDSITSYLQCEVEATLAVIES